MQCLLIQYRKQGIIFVKKGIMFFNIETVNPPTHTIFTIRLSVSFYFRICTLQLCRREDLLSTSVSSFSSFAIVHMLHAGHESIGGVHCSDAVDTGLDSGTADQETVSGLVAALGRVSMTRSILCPRIRSITVGDSERSC